MGTDATSDLSRTDLQSQIDAAKTALERTANARSFAKPKHVGEFLDRARRLLVHTAGVEALYELAPQFESAGIFALTDWDTPETLKPRFVPHTFDSTDHRTVTLECLSELRLLAIAQGAMFHAGMSAEQAANFLTQVLAFNLQILFGMSDEASRQRGAATQQLLECHLNFVANNIGYESLLDHVVDEVWRLLRQRPVHIEPVRQMITRLAVCLFDPAIKVTVSARGAERLVSALYGPTQGCQDDPGLTIYSQRLAGMDEASLEQEARGFARAMHDTGVVSPYHATFIQQQGVPHTHLLVHALGLSSTGSDALNCYRELVMTLVEYAIHPETCQSIYGLALMLERGILYQPGIAPDLWRIMHTPMHPAVAQKLTTVFGPACPPQVFLLAGILSVLGQPLGVGQGNNPACQSTRALAYWAYSVPDYLLGLIRWALRDNTITLHFEGQPIESGADGAGVVTQWSYDLDPVSVLLSPHLDRIYTRMGEMVADRPDDPHRWINPELHGWRVHRGFALAVDLSNGALKDFDTFIRIFYTLYHPLHNGNTPVVHPQPAGIAVTDSQARFVGWHAITIMRLSLDQDNEMRVYFFNPNNDSGQDWGNGVHVSTEGRGEQFGESSLPVTQFISRLYLFHYDVTDCKILSSEIPSEEVEEIKEMAVNSWAQGRV
ncbi:hypothetical protein QQM79_07655 [Marinobacteraceae bacterium S3BR75-40.1]